MTLPPNGPRTPAPKTPKAAKEDLLPNAAAGLDPDRTPLGEMAAGRLARLSGLAVEDLVKHPIAELAERHRFRIDPALFLFRRICGRVVKRDPASGALLPVPFATVHVEDTDCQLLGWFPPGWPYGWYFPLNCKREVIATTKTDACGRFCVWVPRFDIDWVLRWRAQRICFDVIFRRPSLADLLDDLDGIRVPELIRWPEPPIPRPDPPPLLRDGGFTLRRAAEVIGREAADLLARAESAKSFGGPSGGLAARLAATPLRASPPPLPQGLGDVEKEQAPRLAQRLPAELLKQFRPDRWIGPFRRCTTVLLPEWVPLLDVPDITFRVTQDVNGDGTEDVIYSEGYFDVRWNAGAIPDVTLEASQIAIAGVACDVPAVACGNVPALTFAGLMPLINPAAPAVPYHDGATGYGKRANRPRASGLDPARPADFPLAPATAPYCGTLQIYGCAEVGNAAFYKLRYRQNAGPQVAFTGLTWPLHRIVGGALQTVWQAPDAAGWYPVRPQAEGWHPSRLLLNWPTGSFVDGHYEVTMETGNAAKAVLQTAAPVAFRLDNSAPTTQFLGLRWRVAGGAWSLPLELICPVIRRPAGADIEIEVRWLASATHMRSAFLRGGGCGGSAPVLASSEASAEHWHTSAGDNAVSRTAVFVLPGSALQGAYSFSLDVASRAFNPAGGDGGFEADWFYDPVYIHVVPWLPVAVVNL
ncbi:hypothetical protein ACQW02_09195 [Humitalea sp. 24SJ18S-53]|uniref:hypothetical protein n=1 Tax=Humitalea sp. 24SJ18S-53 TaxID=3422307 RepID=UPI003D676727